MQGNISAKNTGPWQFLKAKSLFISFTVGPRAFRVHVSWRIYRPANFYRTIWRQFRKWYLLSPATVSKTYIQIWKWHFRPFNDVKRCFYITYTSNAFLLEEAQPVQSFHFGWKIALECVSNKPAEKPWNRSRMRNSRSDLDEAGCPTLGSMLLALPTQSHRGMHSM